MAQNVAKIKLYNNNMMIQILKLFRDMNLSSEKKKNRKNNPNFYKFVTNLLLSCYKLVTKLLFTIYILYYTSNSLLLFTFIIINYFLIG